MSAVSLDAADAVELAEVLQFLDHWLRSDHDHLAISLARYVGSLAYGPRNLHEDFCRFQFLLGVTDGESVVTPDAPLAHPRALVGSASPPPVGSAQCSASQRHVHHLLRTRQPAISVGALPQQQKYRLASHVPREKRRAGNGWTCGPRSTNREGRAQVARGRAPGAPRFHEHMGRVLPGAVPGS
jgi:hypothetical protein